MTVNVHTNIGRLFFYEGDGDRTRIFVDKVGSFTVPLRPITTGADYLRFGTLV